MKPNRSEYIRQLIHDLAAAITLVSLLAPLGTIDRPQPPEVRQVTV